MDRLGLMVSGEFLCVRASKITRALQPHGLVHDGFCRTRPPQFPELAYRRLTTQYDLEVDDLVKAVSRSDAEIIHVHNEPNWPVTVLKEAGETRPIILNVHDVASARPKHKLDRWEATALEDADAVIWTSPQQRDFARSIGLPVDDKPTAVVGNYTLKEHYVYKRLFPYHGGIVYAGGAEPRGTEDSWRDHSPIADALDGELFILPGNQGVNYGRVLPMEQDYEVYINRLSQFDWGFSGYHNPHYRVPAWEQTVPNKVYEYLAAGIPVALLNSHSLEFLAKAGVAIVIDRPTDLRKLPKRGTKEYKKYKKRVLEYREHCSMDDKIMPIVDLYEELLGGGR